MIDCNEPLRREGRLGGRVGLCKLFQADVPISPGPFANPMRRIYTNSKQDSNVLQYSTVAFTSGAAVVTVVRWVSELK